MFVQLILLLTSFSSFAKAVCFNDGVSWTDDFLQDIITLHIQTAAACLDLCTNTVDCIAFPWLPKDYEDHHFAESCLTYSKIGTPESCKECISGRLANCQVCSQPVECHISENLLAAVPAWSEIDCQSLCAVTEGCGYYTWIESSTFLEKICFLLSSCGDTVDCTGFMSGPPQCQTDYCTEIEYNELDDPIRNENHRK